MQNNLSADDFISGLVHGQFLLEEDQPGTATAYAKRKADTVHPPQPPPALRAQLAATISGQPTSVVKPASISLLICG